MFNSNAIDFNEIYYDSQLNISEKLAKINVILIKHASNFTQATFAESQKYTLKRIWTIIV